MQIGIAFQTDKPLARYGPLAARAEEYGFDVVSVYNDLYFQPAWLPLLEIARATRRVWIGPAAVNPFTCHPVNIAGNIALIEEASQGRAFLGLARGAWLDSLGIAPAEPASALGEAVTVIRQLLAGGKDSFQGESFRLAPAGTLRWNLPERRIPFLLGSWGPKTIKECGPWIEEVKLGGTANPEIVGLYGQLLNGIGGEQPIRLVVGCVSVVDRDGQRARQLARRESALYLPVIAKLDTTLDLEPDLLKRITEAECQGDIAAAGRLIPDHVLDRIALAGTPSQVIDQALALRDAGAHRVDFGTPHGLSEEEGLQLLGQEVVPHL